MKMLMFDFRESEKDFFEKNEFKDIEITFIEEPLNEYSQLSEEMLEETDIISVFISSKLTEEVIKKFKNLRIITTRSTGYNHIDVKYCSQNHIAVFNVEEYGKSSVAQYTFALILALVRNLIPAYLDIQKSLINHKDYEGRNISALTIGIIGCGAIGTAVATLAKSFGMNILVNSYAQRDDIATFARYVSIEELLKESDIITLHFPYTSDHYHFLGVNEFQKMKDGVYIINTARGELIDILVLYENLVSGKVKGVALDVLECEELTFGQANLANLNDIDSKCTTSALITQKLLAMDNVIITPHIAYNTKESIDTLLKTTFNNIRDFMKGNHNNKIC